MQGWNPIRQRGGTFDLFANMKGPPKAAAPRQLSRKALHAVQSSPSGSIGDAGTSPSKDGDSGDDIGSNDAAAAASTEKPRPPMLKRSDRSGPPPLLRSGGNLSLTAIAAAESKMGGDSLIEVSMSASIASNHNSSVQSESAANVSAAPFTMCEVPSALAHAKQGLGMGLAPSPAPSAAESFARFADESNMMMDRTAAINLLDDRTLASKENSVLAPPGGLASSVHLAAEPQNSGRNATSPTLQDVQVEAVAAEDVGNAAMAAEAAASLPSPPTATTSIAPAASLSAADGRNVVATLERASGEASRPPPSSAAAPSAASSSAATASLPTQPAQPAENLPPATTTTTQDTNAPVVNEMSIGGPQARSTPDIPEGGASSSPRPIMPAAGNSSASHATLSARNALSSSSLSRSMNGSMLSRKDSNGRNDASVAGSSVSFHGIGASTPEIGNRNGNISVDDLLELSSRLNDSSSSRYSHQLNESTASQISRLDASVVSHRGIDESGVLDDTQLQNQMRRVQQQLGNVTTKQLEEQNTSGFLEVETLDTLLENLGVDDAALRLEHAKKFMLSQQCDEEARITKKRFFEAVRAGEFEKWLAEAHEKKVPEVEHVRNAVREQESSSPLVLSYSYNGGGGGEGSPVLRGQDLSNIADYNGDDLSLNNLSGPPSLSLSTMVAENIAITPELTRGQETTLQKLFRDAEEDSRAPAQNISTVLTDWVNTQKDIVSSQQITDVAEQLSRSVANCSIPSMPWPQFARAFKSFVSPDGNLSVDMADSFTTRHAAALQNDREQSFSVMRELRQQVLQERVLRKQSENAFEVVNQSQIVQTRGEIESLNDTLSVMESKFNEADECAKQERRRAATKDKELNDRGEENSRLLAENNDLRTKAERSVKLQAEVDSLTRQLQDAQTRNQCNSFTSAELADVSVQDKKFDGLRRQMEITMQQKDQLLSDMQGVSSTLQEMKQTLKEKDDLNSQLQLELGDIGDELGHLKQENQQLENSLLVTNFATRNHTISIGNSNETLDYSMVEKGGSVGSSVISRMSAQHSDEMKALKEKNGLLESELEHLRVELQQSNAKVTSLEENDSESKTTIERCNEIIKWLYGDLDRCKEQQDDKSSEVEYLTGRIAELEDDLSRNHGKLDEVSAALTQAQVSATVAEQEANQGKAEAQKLVPALQAENLHLRKELGQMIQQSKAITSTTSTKLQASAQTAETAAKEVAQMKTQYSSLKAEASAIKDQNTKLHSEVVRLATEARNAAASKQADADAFVAHAARLQAQIMQLRTPQGSRSNSPALSDASKTKQLQDRVGELQKAVEDLTAQRESLTNALAATHHTHVRSTELPSSSEDGNAIRSLVETNRKLTANITYLLKRTKKLEKELHRAKSSKEVRTEKIHTVVREPAKIYMLRKSRHCSNGGRGLSDVTNSADFSLVQARSATQESSSQLQPLVEMQGMQRRDTRRDGIYVPL